MLKVLKSLIRSPQSEPDGDTDAIPAPPGMLRVHAKLTSGSAAKLAMLAVVMAGAGCAGSFPEAMVDTSPAALVQRFRSCTSPLGVSSELPIFSKGGVSEAGLEHYELGEPGLVSDGYHHALLVDRKQSLAYIVQVGGIADTRTTYGPVRLNFGCGGSASGSIDTRSQ